MRIVVRTMTDDPPTTTLVTFTCPCVTCGYDLKGLAHEARCPECGTPVKKSHGGTTLDRADEAWVGTISRGQSALAWSCTLWLSGVVFGGLAFGALWALMLYQGVEQWRRPAFVASLMLGLPLLAALALLVRGTLLVTTPEPHEDAIPSNRRTSRALLAVLVALGVALAFLSVVTPLGGSNLPTMLADALVIAFVSVAMLLAIAGTSYLSRLAIRLPDAPLGRRLERRARTLAALAGVTAVSVVPGHVYDIDIQRVRDTIYPDAFFVALFLLLLVATLVAGARLTFVMFALSRRLRASRADPGGA